MLRDVLLGRAEIPSEGSDRSFAGPQTIEQSDPHGLGQKAKALSDQLGQIWGKRMGQRPVASLCRHVARVLPKLFS